MLQSVPWVYPASRGAVCTCGGQDARRELWLAGSHGACKCLSLECETASAPCARAVSQHSHLRSRRGLEATDSGWTQLPALSIEFTKQIVSLAYGKFRLK